MKKLLTAIAVIALIVFAAPAFASNPFVDVPAGHWAYDAVASLSARGMISGYPDGSFKGSQPMTRYEMASIVGRAVAGMASAHQQDVELLKKLVLEFKNELDALGVKVAEIDKRVAVLEDGIGGWKLRGIFKFDAKFGGSEKGNYFYTDGKANQFTKERFRLFLTKTIDENTQFYAQYRAGGSSKAAGTGDASNGFWSHLYVDTKIVWDIAMRVGRFDVDFEDDYGLQDDNASMFGGVRVDGFQFKKSYGILDVTTVVGRNSGYEYEENDGDYMHYALNLHLNLSEKAMLGVTGNWSKEDGNASSENVDTYSIYAGYDFTPSIGIKGIYYFQSYGDVDANAWKIALSMKQDLLKITSLWIEYSREDNAFYSNTDRYGFDSNYVGRNKPFGADTSSHFLFVKATQQWNDKFNTFVRYAHADFGTNGYDNATEWGVGIGYQYTPSVFFELAYDQVDHGSSKADDTSQGKESLVRFRTSVSF